MIGRSSPAALDTTLVIRTRVRAVGFATAGEVSVADSEFAA